MKNPDDPNTTWNKISSCIQSVAKDVLSKSRGGDPPCKDTSWWNEEVKAAIKIKRNSYRDLKKDCDGVSFERYKLPKKEAKKAVQNAKAKVYKDVYEKLDTKYRITRIRGRNTRDLYTVRCVKDENQKILGRDEEIKERWREYFDKLFNGSSTQDLDDLTIQFQEVDRNYMRRISESEVKETFKRMKSRKAIARMEFLLRYGDA